MTWITHSLKHILLLLFTSGTEIHCCSKKILRNYNISVWASDTLLSSKVTNNKSICPYCKRFCKYNDDPHCKALIPDLHQISRAFAAFIFVCRISSNAQKQMYKLWHTMLSLQVCATRQCCFPAGRLSVICKKKKKGVLAQKAYWSATQCSLTCVF